MELIPEFNTSVFQPMRAPHESFSPETLSAHLNNTLDFSDYYMSPKLDGVRAIIKEGEIYSASLTPLPNKQLRIFFKEIIEYTKNNPHLIFEGELYSYKLTFGEIISVCMSNNKLIDPESSFYLHLFDLFDTKNPFATAKERFIQITKNFGGWEYTFPNVLELPHQLACDLRTLDRAYKNQVNAKGEGLILVKKDSRYKHGRVTLAEATVFKLKKWETFDAQIIEVVQATKVDSTAEIKVNHLGYAQTSKKIGDRIPIPSAAGFKVRYQDSEVVVSLTSVPQMHRTVYWTDRDLYIGRTIEYKGMLVGSKSVPRHPTFVRFREDKDI